jgi:hypothetical protein
MTNKTKFWLCRAAFFGGIGSLGLAMFGIDIFVRPIFGLIAIFIGIILALIAFSIDNNE